MACPSANHRESHRVVPILVFLHFGSFSFLPTEGLYQNILLLLIALPLHTASLSTTPWSPLDTLSLLLSILFLLGETIADNQQRAFQELKSAGRDPTGHGFVSEGLFAYSRHPNFFCEMGFWWGVYAFAAAATGGAGVHWTIVGPALLTLLFQGSTAFTEWISGRKYPFYKVYQRVTSRLIPLPRSETVQEAAERLKLL
ncbi:hypothetical protein BDK51DRAFT_47085 [Blyttiomyces helicus]|uniref:Steroid 5-alpha reductase C-terminal domain-containing protein n=1 Tax=Blyttiomyces helicus TaxID=388810 RepID=A0A4P9W2M2_9FUNG|nr:hypothetical protein BDK51DRAFT_47085 [Blyttiomyces helicus]|eukprot:RKO85048.1 hypothetical protein BDK51DRAFT_47085 [Blyttiomyces helicus]